MDWQVAACVWSSGDQFPRLWVVLDDWCRRVSQRHHRQLPTTAGSAALCRRERVYVPVESLGRWTIGAEDSKALLCRRQWIAAESKDRCFARRFWTERFLAGVDLVRVSWTGAERHGVDVSWRDEF